MTSLQISTGVSLSLRDTRTACHYIPSVKTCGFATSPCNKGRL